jgi:hypothetical protein
MKPRFIHYQAISPGNPKDTGQTWARYRGFTAYLSDEQEHMDGSHFVQVRIVYCSIGDAFCKAKARAATDARPAVPVQVKDLPFVLAQAQSLCYDIHLELKPKTAQRTCTNQWAWVWKYFL